MLSSGAEKLKLYTYHIIQISVVAPSSEVAFDIGGHLDFINLPCISREVILFVHVFVNVNHRLNIAKTVPIALKPFVCGAAYFKVGIWPYSDKPHLIAKMMLHFTALKT